MGGFGDDCSASLRVLQVSEELAYNSLLNSGPWHDMQGVIKVVYHSGISLDKSFFKEWRAYGIGFSVDHNDIEAVSLPNIL
jgi:hypothetical protein